MKKNFLDTNIHFDVLITDAFFVRSFQSSASWVQMI